jgi:D-3-phosphoglycerate dehydrogenase
MGVLSNLSAEQPNIINADLIAKEKGIQVVESKVEESKRYVNMMSVSLQSNGVKREVRGTAFPGSEPKLLGIDEYDLDMPLEGDFLLSVHNDMPGIIGRIGTMLGNRNINIARMGLGRDQKGGRALMLVSVDNPVNEDVVKEMAAVKGFQEVRSVELSRLGDREYLQI